MATAWVFAFTIAVRVLIGGCSWWATPTGSSYCSGSYYSPTIEACGCCCFGKPLVIIVVKGTAAWAASGQCLPLARTVSGSCSRGRAAGARIGKRSAASGRRLCLKHYSASVIARQVCWGT